MTAKAFKSAAAKERPYVFDYDHEVAAFYRDHPEQKKKIFFIDASTLPASLLRGEEADEDEISDLISSNGDLADIISEVNKSGICKTARFHEEDYGCIVMKLPRNQNNINLLGYTAAPAMTDVFSFDHESGHLLCEDGQGAPVLRECVADAYALIRHFQRFGADSSAVENIADVRAAEMVFSRETSHFTTPVVEQIIADSKKTDFAALTPAETAALARQYALNNALDPMLVKYITGNLAAFRCGMNELITGDFKPLRDLVNFVLFTSVPEEFKWGAAAVRTLLDGKLGFDGFCVTPPAGEEWTRLRQALDERAARFDSAQPKLVISRALQPK